VNFLGAQQCSEPLGLTSADFAQMPISGTLTTSLKIPICGAVAH